MTYAITIMIAVMMSVIVITAAVVVFQPFTITASYSCHGTYIFGSNNDRLRSCYFQNN